MKLDRAINILETHNKWRRGNIDDMDYTVKDLGIAIDFILTEVKKLNIQPVDSCANDFEKDVYNLINQHVSKGLKKPDLIHKMEYITQSCRVS